MDIGLESIERAIPPPPAGAAAGVPPPESPGDGWKVGEAGVSELAKVAGEEAVDEAALRRDDDFGKLVSKAFDPASAVAALPPLEIG